MSLAKCLTLSVVIASLSFTTPRVSAFQTCTTNPANPCEELPGCPGAPSEYEFGDLTILEGNVIDVSGTLCPDKLGINAGVAVTAPAEGDPFFSVVWQTQVCCTTGFTGGNKILVSAFGLDGTCILTPHRISDLFSEACGTNRNSFHFWPSPAVTNEGYAYITWIAAAQCITLLPSSYPSQLTYGPFNLLDDPGDWPDPVAPPNPLNARREYATSSGIGMVDTTPAASSSWTRVDPVEEVFGLLYESNESAVGSIRGCYDYWTCQERATQRQPCISAREDGTFCVVWSDAENEEELGPAFNIRLQLFNLDGEPIGGQVPNML
jgi:hypothetical protein